MHHLQCHSKIWPEILWLHLRPLLYFLHVPFLLNLNTTFRNLLLIIIKLHINYLLSTIAIQSKIDPEI